MAFGLPGNPVSAFVAFENFVRPALGRMCGLENPDLPQVRGVLTRAMKQIPGRTAYLPAWVSWHDSGWTITPLQWRGSGDIIGFSRCNATVIFPSERESMAEGERAEALLLPDFFQRRRT
jgi:molybdopterin molybdotransferase